MVSPCVPVSFEDRESDAWGAKSIVCAHDIAELRFAPARVRGSPFVTV
jgi:hypothetical protein